MELDPSPATHPLTHPVMRTADFDFHLPESLIALRPAVPRDLARLLVVRESGACEHHTMRDLPKLLRAGDVLTVNDTRVIPARLHGRRLSRDGAGEGAAIEATLLNRVSSSSYRAYVRPAKRLKPEDRVRFGTTLEGIIAARDGPEIEIRFSLEGATLDAAIAAQGDMPLPPYISGKRKPDAQDRADYQTIFADAAGSVAAPTAGLHFTPELLAVLDAAGIAREFLTLHVGAGTFLPVSAEDTADHRMHAEWAELSPRSATRLNAARTADGRIVAVGTTVLRTLESAAAPDGVIAPFRGETRIFITPPHRFKSADVLLTNFHLPRSTLFMLVCAFAGTATMRSAYAEAIAAQYRFYSYGDACLLFRPQPNRNLA